jgi:hypothetical protein
MMIYILFSLFQVSPLAEIITSPIPKTINLPGGKRAVVRSPVPVLVNTSNLQMLHLFFLSFLVHLSSRL